MDCDECIRLEKELILATQGYSQAESDRNLFASSNLYSREDANKSNELAEEEARAQQKLYEFRQKLQEHKLSHK
jgi:hypothetical protein